MFNFCRLKFPCLSVPSVGDYIPFLYTLHPTPYPTICVHPCHLWEIMTPFLYTLHQRELSINTILSSLQFYHFQVPHLFPVNHESQQCLYHLPSLFAGCAGIHSQHLPCAIILHFQYMTMPAYEE